MQTPPGSNKPEDCHSGGLTTLLVRPPRGSGGGSGGGLRPEELVKMFPTPPSLEQHNPIASPCPDMDLLPSRSYQTNSYIGSPQHDHIDVSHNIQIFFFYILLLIYLFFVSLRIGHMCTNLQP